MNNLSNLYIFGDSFSTSAHPDSWTELLRSKYNVFNYSVNGSSEHRIWKNYQNRKPNGLLLFCHTSPSRIFLKDTSTSKSRVLTSHPSCDIIINDIYSKNEQNFIQILESIWDDDYFEDTYKLLIDDMMKIPNSIHITFFNISLIKDNYYEIWQSHKGNINHLSIEGNQLVFNSVDNALANLS